APSDITRTNENTRRCNQWRSQFARAHAAAAVTLVPVPSSLAPPASVTPSAVSAVVAVSAGVVVAGATSGASGDGCVESGGVWGCNRRTIAGTPRCSRVTGTATATPATANSAATTRAAPHNIVISV